VILERLIPPEQRLVTDAEVLQEILHRYTAIEKREAIGPALQVTLDIIDEVFSIEKTEVLRAKDHPESCIAVMERYGVRSILSFDGEYDRWPGLQRIPDLNGRIHAMPPRAIQGCHRNMP
jgi:uncharacterized protein